MEKELDMNMKKNLMNLITYKKSYLIKKNNLNKYI